MQSGEDNSSSGRFNPVGHLQQWLKCPDEEFFH